MRRFRIKNAYIVDGSGSEGYYGNLDIDEGLISSIHRIDYKKDNLDKRDYITDLFFSETICIDLDGITLTPGFIDMHRHFDSVAVLQTARKQAGYEFGEIELAQGITTAFCGLCGLSPHPFARGREQMLLDLLKPCLGTTKGGLYKAGRFAALLDIFGAYLNVGFFAGSCAMRIAIKGFDPSPLTFDEMKLYESHINNAMELGAHGISMGIMYMPEFFSSPDELAKIASLAKKAGGILSCHIRGEGDSLEKSVEEVLYIAERADISLEISHFKAAGIKNWGAAIEKSIEKIDRARSRGVDVNVDFYPYDCGATTLASLIPPSFMKNNPSETWEYMGTKEGVRDFREKASAEYEDWDNFIISLGFSNITINSVSKNNRIYIGKTIRGIVDEFGFEDGFRFICHIMHEEKGMVGIIVKSMSMGDVDAVARLPYSIVISDALYNGSERPHPRLFGSFPKIIRDFVVERKVLTLPEAIKKMTYMPAQKLGLAKRGLIKEGYIADINIFDPKRLKDTATYEEPGNLAKGMDYVFVGGKIAMKDCILIGSQKLGKKV